MADDVSPSPRTLSDLRADSALDVVEQEAPTPKTSQGPSLKPDDDDDDDDDSSERIPSHGLQPEHSQLQLLRAVFQVKNWAESLETQSKGRKTCQLMVEAADLARLCRVVQWMHGEFETVTKQSREAAKSVTIITAQAKSQGKSLQANNTKIQTMQKDQQADMENLRKDYVKKTQFETAANRVSRIETRLMEEVRVESARMNSELLGLQEVSRGTSEGLHTMLDRLEELDDVFNNHTRRLLDEKNRVDNATFRVHNNQSSLQEVREKIQKAEGLRPELQQVSKAIAALSKDLSSLKCAQLDQQQGLQETRNEWVRQKIEMGIEPSGGGGGGVGGGLLSEKEVRELKEAFERFETMEDLLKQFSQVQNSMQARLRTITSTEADFNKLGKKVQDLDWRTTTFEKYVTEQLASVTQTKAKHALANFGNKWFHKHKEELLKLSFVGWKRHVAQSRNLKEALTRTNKLYTRTHAVTRLRSWWYITLKDMVNSKCQNLADVVSVHAVQLDGLQEIVSRHEKASAEQARGLISRMNMVEKGCEILHSKKADMTTVQELVDGIVRRLEKDHDLTATRKNIEELIRSVGTLEREKMDADVAERQRKKALEQINDLRNAQDLVNGKLDSRASVGDLAQKAETKVVEEVVVLLAKQADQLAGLVAADLERIRAALGRFLELSPDTRKAALSLGLNPNERCVMCGPTRDGASEPHIGNDGKAYRADFGNSASEQAKFVFQQKLQVPSLLLSSLALAGSDWQTGQGQVPGSPRNEHWALLSAGVVGPQVARPGSSHGQQRPHMQEDGQNALPLLRKLVTEAPGWSARLIRGEDASRASTATPSTMASRSGMHSQAQSPTPPPPRPLSTPLTAAGRGPMPSPCATPPPGSVAQSRRGSRDDGDRRAQTARSYFPAVGTVKARGVSKASED